MIRFLFFWLLLTQVSGENSDPCSHLAEWTKEVVRVRELKPLRALGCRIISEEEMRRQPWVVSNFGDILRTLPYDEIVFKMLGFVPQYYPLTHCVTAFGPEVPLALYDPSSETILVKRGVGEGRYEVSEQILRAILEQNFQIREAEQKAREFTDRELAFSGVLNGHVRNTLGLIGLQFPEVDEEATVSTVGPECAPPETLLFLGEFAQQFGLRYVDTLRTTLGTAGLNFMFQHPPATTTDVLYKRFSPKEVQSENALFVEELLQKGKTLGYNRIHQDRLGEYFTRTLIRDYLGSPPALGGARGWRDDALLLFQNSQQKYLLLWKVAWASNEDAREFFQAMRIIISQRYGNDFSRTLDSFIYQHPTGDRVEVVRREKDVLIDIRR